jgi:periplasmic protein CpxP/Spy
MYMKRLLLINSFVFALLSASVVSAEPAAQAVNAPTQKAGHCRSQYGKELTGVQRNQLQQIRKGMRAQLLPLIKEKRALKLQILGKIATPNAQWNEIASLVEKSNATQAKIALLVAKTRFETYQKLGIVFPQGHHQCHVKNMVRK